MASQPLKYVYQWQVDIANYLESYSRPDKAWDEKYVLLAVCKYNNKVNLLQTSFSKGMYMLCDDFKDFYGPTGRNLGLKTGSVQARNQLYANIETRILRPVREWEAAGRPTQPIDLDAQEVDDMDDLDEIINGGGGNDPETPKTPETPPTPNKSSVVDNLVDTVKDDPKKGLVWLAIALAVVLVIRKIIKK